MSSQEAVPYWNVNVPPAQQTEECPDFLVNCTAPDRKSLSVPDEQFHRMSWEDVKEVIRTNDLAAFKRQPSDFRRYLAFLAKIKASHGSVLEFIMQERVKWTDTTPRAGPFQEPSDLKILYNDWPYGIDRKIVHLVVWVKFAFEEDQKTGDLTDAARAETEAYVDKTIRRASGSKEVIWFKNWAAIKSVHALEHFHVMLYDPNPKFIEEVTGGDVPMSKR